MMKKLLALLSLTVLVSAFTGCSSNPAKVEASNAAFSNQVEAEAESTGDLTKNFAAGS